MPNMIDVNNYEGLYAVTKDGKVWSHKRQIFLRPATNKGGYLTVILYKNHKKKSYLVHRLVAEVYVYNPKNLPFINHINENKADNRVENLEWITKRDNNNYGTRNTRIAVNNGRVVLCVENNTIYDSTRQASRCLNLDHSAIAKVCRGVKKTCGGYHFKYIEEVCKDAQDG